MRLILVRIWRDNLPKYGRPITKFFLGTALTTGLGASNKFQCGSCNATYYGKTKRRFKVRMCEHLGISALTGKRVKGDDDPPLKNIFYSAITHLDLKISQFLQATTMTLKSR